MMFSIPSSQKYWKTNVFRVLEWKSTLNKAFGVFFQMPFSFLAIWKNGNRIWKNAPNALFEVLSNFKMRKVFVFKCFWDVGIGKCMNCRRAAAENATRVRGMGLALVRCKEQPRLTIACPRRRSAGRQGAGSHPRPPHLENSWCFRFRRRKSSENKRFRILEWKIP